jgi:hypothetical protein
MYVTSIDDWLVAARKWREGNVYYDKEILYLVIITTYHNAGADYHDDYEVCATRCQSSLTQHY